MLSNNTLLNLRINQLEHFYVAARFKSFNKAADVLGISQPSLSESIKKLETTFEAPLFKRGSKGLELTELGQEVYIHAQAIHSSVFDIKNCVNNSQTNDMHTIRLGTCSIKDGILDPISDFLKHNKDIRIHLESRNMSVMTDQLDTGYFDVAIIPHGAISSALVGIPFKKLEFGILIPPTHPLADIDPIEPEMLSDETILVPRFEKPIEGDVINYFGSTNNSSPMILTDAPARNEQELRYIVEQGKGLGILPYRKKFSKASTSRAYIHFLSPSLDIDFSLVWLKQKYIRPSLQSFIDYISQDHLTI